MNQKRFIQGTALVCSLWMGLSTVWAAEEKYKIDPTHSFVTFTIPHLGYSLLQGRFNKIDGAFSVDANQGTIQVTVETASIDSNHAERDKHLKGKDFLDVEQFPKAEFKSKRIVEKEGKAQVEGDFTLHGVTKPITFEAKLIGTGPDPWGGFRRGYAGSLRIKRSDYKISYNLGPAAEEMDLGLYIEGIRQ
ncbi:MAG: YceI family protein [Magnetococcales bacterium]|nr:YceI family protein [Magnetococcales bacterium]MBF0437826.1 YceI family protein [Magnetococcales bacterium]